MTVTTRLGEVRDAPILAHFNLAMASETEDRRLDPDTVTAGVRSLLGHPAAGFYLVAEQGDDVVAALMVTYEWSDWRNGRFWWIQSVYVTPSHRRQGVFKKLFEGVRSLARQQDDVCGLRLYVEQDNAVAQATYKSLGMDPTRYNMYEIEFAVQTRGKK